MANSICLKLIERGERGEKSREDILRQGETWLVLKRTKCVGWRGRGRVS